MDHFLYSQVSRDIRGNRRQLHRYCLYLFTLLGCAMDLRINLPTEDDSNFRRQIQDNFEKKCPKFSYGGQKHLQSFSKRTSNEKKLSPQMIQ